MSASFTYAGTDMETLGLHCDYPLLPFQQDVDVVQLKDKAVGLGAALPPLEISLTCDITAASHGALITAIDNIKAILASESEKALNIDIVPGRYWNAWCIRFQPTKVTAVTWTGVITFMATDSRAYASSLTSSNHNIDADPDTISETPGGKSENTPIWTLTAGEDLTDVTVTINNTTTGESLSWDGTLSNGDVLEIDTANWTVKVNGTESMSGLDPTSKFPALSPGVANSITVTGFGATGSLNISYRNRY